MSEYNATARQPTKEQYRLKRRFTDGNGSPTDPETIRIAKEMSRHVQARLLTILLPVGVTIIAICIALVSWLAIHGPALVLVKIPVSRQS